MERITTNAAGISLCGLWRLMLLYMYNKLLYNVLVVLIAIYVAVFAATVSSLLLYRCCFMVVFCSCCFSVFGIAVVSVAIKICSRY